MAIYRGFRHAQDFAVVTHQYLLHAVVVTAAHSTTFIFTVVVAVQPLSLVAVTV